MDFNKTLENIKIYSLLELDLKLLQMEEQVELMDGLTYEQLLY
jgi:hypothetical protein